MKFVSPLKSVGAGSNYVVGKNHLKFKNALGSHKKLCSHEMTRANTRQVCHRWLGKGRNAKTARNSNILYVLTYQRTRQGVESRVRD